GILIVFQPFMAEFRKKQGKLLIHILDRPFSCDSVEHQCNVKERHVPVFGPGDKGQPFSPGSNMTAAEPEVTPSVLVLQNQRDVSVREH
ncbi:MAG: hypothetical protein PUG73_09145, partial [Pseudomonadota bacterium]|nr:hypothetical protein [Pseudomonadota bacterium]